MKNLLVLIFVHFFIFHPMPNNIKLIGNPLTAALFPNGSPMRNLAFLSIGAFTLYPRGAQLMPTFMISTPNGIGIN